MSVVAASFALQFFVSSIIPVFRRLPWGNAHQNFCYKFALKPDERKSKTEKLEISHGKWSMKLTSLYDVLVEIDKCLTMADHIMQQYACVLRCKARIIFIFVFCVLQVASYSVN